MNITIIYLIYFPRVFLKKILRNLRRLSFFIFGNYLLFFLIFFKFRQNYYFIRTRFLKRFIFGNNFGIFFFLSRGIY